MKGRWIPAILVLVIVLAGCAPALPLRSDMSTDGLQRVVKYTLEGPAGTEQEENVAELRGVNQNAPTLQQRTVFGKVSGTKTQDVEVITPDGKPNLALGMAKTKRHAGITQFMTVESATYSATDVNGNCVCGAKIRLDFNRNLSQYFTDQRDFQTLWYYDIPCDRDGDLFSLDFSQAKLRALVVNEVWQARIAWGSYFFNWGHSVTVVDGLPATLPGGWWMNLDDPTTDNDSLGAAKLLNNLVLDLERSQSPWVEFTTGGQFDLSGSYLIYSSGDADQYATWNRVLLDRQNQYVVMYRPDKDTAWDWLTINPVYNWEWNDAGQNIAKVRSYGDNPFNRRLNSNGLPKTDTDSVISELERIGWMNGPNPSLEQIQFIAPDGSILYCMTIRAYVGAKDTLVMFSRVKPDLTSIRQSTPASADLPRPILYDSKGQALSEENQPYNDQTWAEFLREATMWNWMKDNPRSLSADLFVQYRFSDNTTWRAIPCSDGGTCGYEPVEWHLAATYYMNGDSRVPWLVSQLLGEVGVRTLGMSYCSGRYEGTGMLFALAQDVYRDEFYHGFGSESIWRFDARALQLPDTLAEAWQAVHAAE